MKSFIEVICALAIGFTIGALPGCKHAKSTKGGKVENALIEDHRKMDFKTDVHVEIPPWRRNVDTRGCTCCRGGRCTCGKTCRCKCTKKPVKVDVRAN